MWQYKSSQKVIVQFAILISTVMISTCTKGSVTFSDAVFNASDWQLVTDQGGNGGNVSFSQEPTGGNPDEHLRITVTVNAAPPYSIVYGAFFHTSAIYNPQTQGEIVTLEYREDSIMFNGFGNGQHSGLALRQNGVLYYANYPTPGAGLIRANQSSWTHHSFTSLQAENFGRPYTPNVHPDFSSEGSPIEFGFYRADSTPSFGYSIIAGIDNWSVTIHNKPLDVGLLQVIIEPQGAVDAGAQWRRQGTLTWYDSGHVEMDVPVGEHIIEFKDVSDYITPDNQTGILELQGQLHLVGSYLFLGSATLSVETIPVAGEIFVNVQTKGLAPWTGIIPPGRNTISFGPVAGYLTPSDQAVIIADGGEKNCTGTYVNSNKCGRIEVTTDGAAGSFTIMGPATYFGDGSDWIKYNVPCGQYTIKYEDVFGYETPTSQIDELFEDGVINFMGKYESLAKPYLVVDGLIINGKQCPYVDNVPEILNVGSQVAIYGRSIGANGLPVGDMEIAVTDPDRCQTLSIRSDSDGRFVYPQSFLEQITWWEHSYPQFIFWLVTEDSLNQRVIVPLTFVDPSRPLSNSDYIGITAILSSGRDSLIFEGEFEVIDETTGLPILPSDDVLKVQPYLYKPGEIPMDAAHWASLHNAIVRAEYMGGTLPFSPDERQQIKANYDQYIYLKSLNDIAELTTNINHWIWENKGTILVGLVALPVVVKGGMVYATVKTGSLVLADVASDRLLEDLLPKVFGEDDRGRKATKIVILVKKLILLKAVGVPPAYAYPVEHAGFAYKSIDTIELALDILEDFVDMGCPPEYIECDSLASNQRAMTVLIQAPSDPSIGFEGIVMYSEDEGI